MVVVSIALTSGTERAPESTGITVRDAATMTAGAIRTRVNDVPPNPGGLDYYASRHYDVERDVALFPRMRSRDLPILSLLSN